VSRALLVALALSASAEVALAREAALRVAGESHFVGTPVELSVIAEGFEKEPEPQVTFDPPTGGRLDFSGLSPNISTSISVVNGVVSQSERVQFVFRYRFLAGQPGRYRIGPFRVEQAGAAATTRAVELSVQTVPQTERMSLQLGLPAGPVYPGQRVPIIIEWVFDAELRDRMQRYSISSELFERTNAFRFVAAPPQRDGAELVIETPEGRIALPARAVLEHRGQSGQMVVRAERLMIPLGPGSFELEPATVVVDEVTRWRGRSLFGGRVPAEVRKLRADDVQRTLVVRAIPTEDRPASFAGAVGRGFSLEAQADRSVVRVGDPIQLTLVLRGDGNLEAAGLPDLSSDGGLDPTYFRVPEGEPGGRLEDGAKTFTVAVRALDEAVAEVPPLAYSYFDPDTAEFVTVRSRPIALSVRPATLVTARDVIGPAGAERVEGPSVPGAEPSAHQGQSAARALALTGANLSIVRETERLLESGAGRARALWLEIGVYLSGVAALALAVVARRRADVDPALLARRRALLAQRARIARAGGRPTREALATMADALRAMVRVAETGRSANRTGRSTDLDAFIAECDAVTYAPAADGDVPVSGERQQRALGLADALLEGVS
jgi:hypothetical protein